MTDTQTYTRTADQNNPYTEYVPEDIEPEVKPRKEKPLNQHELIVRITDTILGNLGSTLEPNMVGRNATFVIGSGDRAIRS